MGVKNTKKDKRQENAATDATIAKYAEVISKVAQKTSIYNIDLFGQRFGGEN